MNITAFIIDDERKAISILKNKLERVAPEILVTGEFQNSEKALEALEKNIPDLIFLDILMPQINGFEFLKQITKPAFELIFVTAYGDYAIEAIRHCAIGYLIKPVKEDELCIAIENAQKNIEQKTALAKNLQLVENLSIEIIRHKKIAVPSFKGLDFIEIQNIIRCEGSQGYTILYLKSGEQLVSSYSIGFYYKMLENLNFFLTHKSHLINIDYIHKYDRNGTLELEDHHTVPLARNRREIFLKRIVNL